MEDLRDDRATCTFSNPTAAGFFKESDYASEYLEMASGIMIALCDFFFIPGGPQKNGTVDTVDFQHFALITSYLYSPRWLDIFSPL